MSGLLFVLLLFFMVASVATVVGFISLDRSTRLRVLIPVLLIAAGLSLLAAMFVALLGGGG